MWPVHGMIYCGDNDDSIHCGTSRDLIMESFPTGVLVFRILLHLKKAELAQIAGVKSMKL